MMSSAKYILIVEDELIIANNIASILKKCGYESITIVNTVPKAVAAIEKNRPLVVLTDIMLGQAQSGIDLGQLLSQQYQIPFIYITSHSSSEIVGQAKLTYPNAYITKPFKKEDIAVAVELALFNTTLPKSETEQQLLVKDGRVWIKIPCAEITYLEADANYTKIQLRNGKSRLVRYSLSELGVDLPSDFMRIHKSFIVNLVQVSAVGATEVTLDSLRIPIGRTYQQELNERWLG